MVLIKSEGRRNRLDAIVCFKQLQLNILMAIAEFERSIIQERVGAGLRAAKAKGVKLGRPETLFRHRVRVLSMLAEGFGVRAIARELGLPLASAGPNSFIPAVRSTAYLTRVAR
jgi:DNA invertase Pin-like site-specific DNA recombinase